MKKPANEKLSKPQVPQEEVKKPSDPKVVAEKEVIEALTRSNPGEFAKMVAREIVRNLTTLTTIPSNTITSLGKLRPFARDVHVDELKDLPPPDGDNRMIVDTSILVDGRILPIVNSGFLTGTLLIPEFVLGEVQHIADSSDSLRRAKGRRGLEVVTKLKGQRTNDALDTKIIKDDLPEVKEVDHKLVALAKQWKIKLITVDFNLAQLARAQSVKVMNVNDLGQALKMSALPGEEITIKITHEGKEREQGVGYLTDGTMVIIENGKDKVGIDVAAVVSKIHQTPAGQLFFARLK